MNDASDRSKRLVVLSIDSEIFGNGSGDPRQHIVEPNERMLRLGDEFAAPFTIFFETEEYMAFVRYRDALRRDLGYDPAQLMRDQAIDLIRRGHDLQLHLHPQWVNARYDQGRWHLDATKNAVDDLFPDQQSVTRYISERKAVLEEMAGIAQPGRQVRAYRAGAFCAQPGERLLTALALNGFVIETSVVKGLWRRSDFGCFDFRMAPARKQLWRVCRDVVDEDPRGRLYEIPVHSVMQRRYRQATFRRLRAKFSKNVPREKQMEMVRQLGVKRSPWGLFRFLFEPVPVKLDCHNLAAGTLYRWIKAVKREPKALLDVVVVIGHSKEHVDDSAMRRFLERLKSDPEIKVVTLDRVATLLGAALAEVEFGAQQCG